MLSRPITDPGLTEQMREFCREKGLPWPSEFKPCIYWNEGLEVVEVLVADTSYTETQLTNSHFLGVFERNHHLRYKEEHFVGFNLWVVKGVCALMSLEPVGKLSMRQILEFLYEREQDDQYVRDAIKEILLPMLEEHGLDEFEIPA